VQNHLYDLLVIVGVYIYNLMSTEVEEGIKERGLMVVMML
jgi:hypothetical protein